MLKPPWREYVDLRNWHKALPEDQKRMYNRKMFHAQMILLWVWIGGGLASMIFRTSLPMLVAICFATGMFWWAMRLRRQLGHK